jgi:EpsI family protein
MIRRRDLILAGLGVAALGTAEYLRPRRRLVLAKNLKIDDIIPKKFGHWEAEASSGLVGPEMAGRLARSLYSETVQRTYHDANSGAAVMLLAAYGDTQSDLLQLHRPESCYPAVGYSVTLTKPENIAITRDGWLPARRVIATTGDTTENIIYWTRLGERLPQSGGEQRNARLANSIDGIVADGILMRCSMVGDSDTSFRQLDTFVVDLLAATRRDGRPALVGTKLARMMA